MLCAQVYCKAVFMLMIYFFHCYISNYAIHFVLSNLSFFLRRCNTDLNDSDCEACVLRGVNFNVQNPNDVDTYVKLEFPYPSVSIGENLLDFNVVTYCKCNVCIQISVYDCFFHFHILGYYIAVLNTY